MVEVELVPLVERPEYRITYHQYGPIKVIHVDVHKWTPRVARQFKVDVEEAFESLSEPAFVAYFINGPQGQTFLKFIRRYGFVPFQRGEYLGQPCIYFAKVNNDGH